MHVSMGACRGQERVSDSLELELQAVVSRANVLWKSVKSAYLPSHLSCPVQQLLVVIHEVYLPVAKTGCLETKLYLMNVF